MLTKNVASTINKMIKQDASTKKAKAGGYLLPFYSLINTLQ
jgi:hypothetical protein